MKNIVLTGMMGCGKSTCARKLAARLALTAVDMDEEIVKQAGRSIPEIFAQDGEPYFRDLESACARALSERESLVIATGGGVVLRRENMDALRRSGVVFFLNRPANQIFGNVDMRGRPLAQNGKEAFLETFSKREAAYRGTADFVVEEFSSPEATVREICRLLEGIVWK